MIPLNMIKTEVVRKLSGAIPEVSIVTEDVPQASDPVLQDLFPLVHVQLVPSVSTQYGGPNTVDRTILLDLTYMEQTKSSNAAMYDMLERMQMALGLFLLVDGRALKFENIQATIADDLAHLIVTIEFNDSLPDTGEVYEKFGDLQMKI